VRDSTTKGDLGRSISARLEEITREKVTGIGLENAALEPWGMLGRSWELERFSAEMTAPFYFNLIAHPEAWTSGTNGVISGEPILIDASTVEDLEEYAGTLAGKIVLVGGSSRIPAVRNVVREIFGKEPDLVYD